MKMNFNFSCFFPSKTLLIITNIFNAISNFFVRLSELISGPLISPARTTLFVVVKVSQATLENGSSDKKLSTTISEILSDTLSG